MDKLADEPIVLVGKRGLRRRNTTNLDPQLVHGILGKLDLKTLILARDGEAPGRCLHAWRSVTDGAEGWILREESLGHRDPSLGRTMSRARLDLSRILFSTAAASWS